MIDFSKVKKITLPNGDVATLQIDGVIVWTLSKKPIQPVGSPDILLVPNTYNYIYDWRHLAVSNANYYEFDASTYSYNKVDIKVGDYAVGYFESILDSSTNAESKPTHYNILGYRGHSANIYEKSEITIPSTYNSLPISNILTLKFGSTKIKAFSNDENLKIINFLSPKLEIQSEAFVGCKNISKVTIPNINYWYDYIFESETSNPTYYAKDLYANGSVCTSVSVNNFANQNYKFINCRSLQSLHLGSGSVKDERVPSDMIFGTNIESITVDSANTIFDSRENCNAIIDKANNELVMGCKNTIIPTSVISLGWGCFSGCLGLEKITIPNSVTSLSKYTFKNCPLLKRVVIPNSVVSLTQDTFDDWNGVEEIIFEEPTKYNESGPISFIGCTNLKILNIPDNITLVSIKNCDNLAELRLGEKSRLDANCCFGCKNLKKIYVNQATSHIDSSAFYNCNSLEEVIIPTSNQHFENPNGNTSVVVKKKIPEHTNTNGDTYAEQPAHLVYVGKNAIVNGTYEIPNYVEFIDDYAFFGLENLTSIVIPSNIKNQIGKYSFYNCKNLKSVSFLNSVETLPVRAFQNTLYEKNNKENGCFKFKNTYVRAIDSNIYIPPTISNLSSHFIDEQEPFKTEKKDKLVVNVDMSITSNSQVWKEKYCFNSGFEYNQVEINVLSNCKVIPDFFFDTDLLGDTNIISITLSKETVEFGYDAFRSWDPYFIINNKNWDTIPTIRFGVPNGVAVKLPSKGGSDTGMIYNKDNRPIRIYTDNETIKNYDWKGDNVTPILYHLDGTAWG